MKYKREHKEYHLLIKSLKNWRLYQNSSSGMSFVEVIVWIGILTLLMAVMTIAIINVYRNNSYTFERAIAVLSVRRGLENTTSIIREAAYSNDGAYPVVVMARNSVTFYADYDNDDSVELLRIFLDAGELKLGVIEPSSSPIEYNGQEDVSVLARNLQNTQLNRYVFTYYDKTGAEVVNMTHLLAPVFIKVDLVANTGNDSSVSNYELHGSAFMRNLKN